MAAGIIKPREGDVQRHGQSLHKHFGLCAARAASAASAASVPTAGLGGIGAVARDARDRATRAYGARTYRPPPR